MESQVRSTDINSQPMKLASVSGTLYGATNVPPIVREAYIYAHG